MSRLIIKNLPPKIKEKKLQDIFGHYGNVTDVKLVYSKAGHFRHFAFIGYQQECEAEKAKNILNNSLVMNNKILVETCKDFGVKEKTKSKNLSAFAKKKISGSKDTQKNSDLAFLLSKKKAHFLDEDMNSTNSSKISQGVANDEDIFENTKYSVTLYNYPSNAKRKQINEFFYPINPIGVSFLGQTGRRNVKLNVAIVKFSNVKDQSEALTHNGEYMGRNCIEIKKGCDEIAKGKLQQETNLNGWIDRVVTNHDNCDVEDLAESGRLYVRNLTFSCTEDELTALFQKFGPLAEVNVPIDNATRKGVGFCFITYMFPEHALMAFSELDGTVFQGRMLHILPAKSKVSKDQDADPNAKSSYKKSKSAADKKSGQSSHNWNSLFMGTNAVAEAISEKYGTDKSDVLNSTKAHSAAVRMALGETHIVKETSDFLTENGISLDAFGQPNAERSKTAILVKNLPVGSTTSSELRSMFEKYAQLGRVVLAPAGVTAVIECLDPSEARNAFTKLAYRNFHKAPLYLEWAPVNTFVSPSSQSSNSVNVKETEEKTTTEKETEQIDSEGGFTLFVKNLNFDTTDDDMRKHFESSGPLSMCMVSKKKTHKSQSLLSMGYGFVTFKNQSDGKEALKKLQHSTLDGHKLELKQSDRKQLVKPDVRKKQLIKKQKTSKILVRNIPFQANVTELTSLFKAFGELKTVRLPKKLTATLGQTGGHRGFAFVDFVTKEDAKNAFNALCHSTHLYGRRLVLEWADADDTSLEELRMKTFSHYHGDKKRKRNLDSLEESIVSADVEADE